MKKTTLFLIILLGFWGCMTFNRHYKLATEAAINKNWDEAIEYYEKAVLENPKEAVYRIALFRARKEASFAHLFQARRLAAEGKKEESLAEYKKALSYDPMNWRIAQEIRHFTQKTTNEVPVNIHQEETILSPFKLDVPQEKITLNFKNMSLRAIFRSLAKHAKINIVFEETFKDSELDIKLEDVDFQKAIDTLCMISRTFPRVLDDKTILIIPDTPQKRNQYELNVIKTFYLSNIDAVDVQNTLQAVLRGQFKVPIVQTDKKRNTLTIRDNPRVVEMAGKLLRMWDKSKGEVIIDFEIMEVSRQKMKDLGLDFESYLLGLKYKTQDETGWLDLDGIDLSKRENYQLSIPTALVKFLGSDVDTKTIAQPSIRGIDGEKIEYTVGDEVPIPRTTFTPIAAGGVSQQPITQFDYEDVGIEVKITPRLHFEGEVTLELEMTIKSLSGTGYGDLPVKSKREIKNVLRLKDGETNLLAGLLKDEERKTLNGIAGIKDIPIIGLLFSNTDQTLQQTDVVMTITPHIIRTVPLSEEDLKAIWMDTERSAVASSEGRILPEDELFRPTGDDRGRARPSGAGAREDDSEASKDVVSLSPPSFNVPQNREFSISVNVRSQEEIGSMTVNVSFDSRIMKLKKITARGFLMQLGEDVPFLEHIDNDSGTCTIGFSVPDVGKGVRGSGNMAVLTFEAAEKGEGSISVTSVVANSARGQMIDFEIGQASSINIR